MLMGYLSRDTLIKKNGVEMSTSTELSRLGNALKIIGYCLLTLGSIAAVCTALNSTTPAVAILVICVFGVPGAIFWGLG